MRKILKIEVDCAVCASRCEEAIRKIEGVDNAVINFITQKMLFEAEDAIFEETLKKAVKAARRIDSDFTISE